MLTLLPLGTGDAFSRSRYSTALLVEYTQGERTSRLLIDAPHPIRKMLAEADPQLDIQHIDALVLTHLHGDHASGVEGLAFASHFGLQRRLQLLAHPQVAEPLWPTKLQSSMQDLLGPTGALQPPKRFEDYFDWRPLHTERPLKLGPWRIECRLTVHHIPTYALRIFTDTGSVGYSADTAWDPSLYDWLSACDLVVHETNLGPAHTPWSALCALTPAQQAKTRVVAWPDGLDVTQGPIEPLRAGQRVVIRPARAGEAP